MLDSSTRLKQIQENTLTCLHDLQEVAQLGQGDLLVVGASTSEIIGEHIGKATSVEVGEALVEAVLAFGRETSCDLAFQCCEHLNRALVVSRSTALRHGWREVSAIPVPGAGGAVASVAYFAMPDACLVESIEAQAGIDIGDTFIGMHIKRVAVPVRGTMKEVGAAHVTMVRSRPPLVGGERAVYDRGEAQRRLKG